jgi:hypothetical protein
MHALRWIKTIAILTACAFAATLLYGYARNHPEDLPWTELDLALPVGAFTGRKLTALHDDGDRCRRLLDRAGIGFTNLPPRSSGPQCGYRDAVRPTTQGSLDIMFQPEGLAVSCPVAASLALWEWHAVQPAALRHFGQTVTAIDHFGSYSCRRIYGRSAGSWSEHATANAVDIAAFRLADGRRISVAADWDGGGAEAAFLREVRDGACPLFATVLSPDYNAAHADHLHFDHAERGRLGWRGCR